MITVKEHTKKFSFEVKGIKVFEHKVTLSNDASGKGWSYDEALIAAIENCNYCDWLYAQDLLK